ncbi:PAN domain-containing protein [Pseudoponticoccus marisrubri]|uniref:Apple domain-containing protein n=1 Tax=Pseudoponticoccus marisrubri TaxID=1685382 RepID=A0A0W7WNN3_9RHOB|nr:PAN domain-containing protein [Pseudoponticoccus marisrubri]KUF12116.1 hypothetical protein AVJ23_05980 [Pseudoponticoccus marisrubri]
MRNLLAAALLWATPALATDCLFVAVPEAGLPGFNDEILSLPSAAACMAACSGRSWCRSVDYERDAGRCFLQSAGMQDADLNRAYAGDPYDHFTCLTRSGGEDEPPRPGQGACSFVAVPDAGIPGHNTETLADLSLAQCQAACATRDWCRSIDYERATGTCYVQDVGMREAALKHDYGGDPYDHYTCDRR